ncbi:hypothetical protein SMAC4_05053 [Sordaria macrospora]|uniref:WGS project CABT00000000 data, contig 2.22 n=1 Tax=Sordaria macrospora (strain ATCC MYA-333 / DSM 997 / K(L3346) / K-hell) TaxID=771870 RepID=F7W2I8_SORMK|nr:uncharacterized protein SMAC_05053 [Sordaria macrospora k-hell]KAH7632576.1 hypothetical protein B0T09DRAFT_299760 [Sordaria sp. MPI-SDFR-AT-0083]WPJ60938.1 hypothetical protein SMAC4_05053 [Sordaria macrospora]CCC11839.1 unnamed protein product [Sordaria macrospora k-hell]
MSYSAYNGISPYGSAYRQESQPQEQQQSEQQRRQSEPKAYRPYQPYRPPTQQPTPSDNYEDDSRRSSVASQSPLASSLAKLDLGDTSMAPAPLRLQRKPVSSQPSTPLKTLQSTQTDQDYKPYPPPSSQHRSSVSSTVGRRTSYGFVVELEGSPPPSRRESNAVQPPSNAPLPKPPKKLETPDSEGLIPIESEALPSVPGAWPTSIEEQPANGSQPLYAQAQYKKPFSPQHEVTQSTPSPPPHPVQYPSAYQQQGCTPPPISQPTYTSAPAQPSYQSFSPPQSPPLPSSAGTPAPFTPQYHQYQQPSYSPAPSPVYSQAPTSPVGPASPPPPYQQQTYGSPPQSPPPPPQSTRPTSQYFSGYQSPPKPTLNTSNLPTPPSQQGPFSPTSPQSPTPGGHRHSVSYFPAAYPPRPSPPTQHPASPTVTSPSSTFPSTPSLNIGAYPPSPSPATPGTQQPQPQPQPTITYTAAPSQPTYYSPTPSFSSSNSTSGTGRPGGALYNFPSPPTPSLNSKLSINGLKRTAAGLGGAIKNVASVVEVAGREAVKAGRAAATSGSKESGSGKAGRRVSGMGFYGGMRG